MQDSQKLRGQATTIKDEFLYKPEVERIKSLIDTERASTEGLFQCQEKFATKPQGKTDLGGHRVANLISSPSSSDSDSECQASPPDYMVNSSRSNNGDNHIYQYRLRGSSPGQGATSTTFSLQNQPHQSSNAPGESRFSFVPGDDIDFPLKEHREVCNIRNRLATKSEAMGRIRLNASEQAQAEQQSERLRARDNGYALGETGPNPDSRVALPASINHDAKTRTISSLWSKSSSESIDTVIYRNV